MLSAMSVGGSDSKRLMGAVRAQRTRALGIGFLSAGAVCVAAGWVSVSGASTTWEQLSYLISGGLGGLLCLGVGVTLLLSAGLRDEQRKLAELAGLTAEVGVFAPPRSRRLPAAAVAVAAVGLLAGWNQAAMASDQDGAVPGLTIGLAALVLAALSFAVHLVTLRQAVQVEKVAVLSPLAQRYGIGFRPAAVLDLTEARRAAVPVETLPAGRVLVAPGLTRFHRPGCPTLAEVRPTPVDRKAVDPSLRPCQLCGADTL